MPASNQVDLTALIAEVERAKGIKDSVIAFLAGIGPKIQAAVTAALEADNAADDASIAAANAAIATTVAELQASDTAISDAITANQ